MAYPCFFAALLVLLATLDSCLGSVPVHELPGDDECDTAGCSYIDADQDDTGLIQAPVRKTVEVTKSRTIVENSVSQEGSAATLGSRAKAPEAHRVPAAAVEVVEAVSDSQAAASALGTGAQVAPLAFFQVSEEKGSTGNGQDNYDPTFTDEAGPGLELSEATVELASPVASNVGEATVVTADPVTADGTDEAEDVDDAYDEASADVDDPAEDTTQVDSQGIADADDSTDEADNSPVSEGGAEWALKVAGDQVASSLRDRLGQVVAMLLAFALVVHIMFRWHASFFRPRDALSAKMRKKLERMNIATGPEIRSICNAENPVSQSVPMRIQGRVVSKLTGPLTAPISGRSCVLYSASVSQRRHDGVHQPPVAFDSSAQDFAVQLEDCPEMLLEINSQDVFPFDMDAGRYACELALGDAPDTWRGFMLAHLTPGVEGGGAKGQSMNRVDLGAKGPLNFRECALVVGSRVTCIGEVVREHNGKLRLCSWSPPLEPEAAGEVTPLKKKRSMSWLTPEADPWLHKLMISDDSGLLSEASQLLLPGKCRSCT